jgi:hypothetical protein
MVIFRVKMGENFAKNQSKAHIVRRQIKKNLHAPPDYEYPLSPRPLHA